MARDGTGNFNLAEPPFVYDTVIDETAMNSDLSDIANGLTQSISKDGQTPIAADLPMSGQKLTGLGDGSARQDSANLAQIQAEGFIWCGTMTGTGDAGVLSPAPSIAAYLAGMRFVWKASGNSNTGPMTVAISGLTTIAVQNNGAALVADDHASNSFYTGVLDTTGSIQILPWQIPATPAGGMNNLIDDTSPQLGGFLDTNNYQVKWSKGADVASAATLPLLTDGNTFDVTGTTTITAIAALGIGTVVKLHFNDSLTLTHSADLVLPGGVDIATTAGDEAELVEYAAGDWRLTNYTPGSDSVFPIPAGVIVEFGGTTAPAGWLLCDGSTGLDSTVDLSLAALYAVITTTYGGTGPDDFDLPDHRGRATIGLDNMGGVSANRITDAAADSLGGTGGSETHTLIESEIPVITPTVDMDNGIQSGSDDRFVGGSITSISSGAAVPNTTPIDPFGGGNAHANDQPWMALNKIIKK